MKIKKICLMLTAIAVLVCTMGIAANAAEYRTISFTDDAQSSDWVILNGMTKKSLTDGIWKGWYSADGMGSEMIFCFDGSKSKTIGDTVYDMNGMPSMLQFCVMSFGNGSISTSEVFVSEDNVEYTSVGMLQSFLNWGDKSLYQDAAGLTYWGGPTFASYTPIRITENSLPSYARFVKIQINKNVGSVGICKPTVTYKQELNGFDVENARAVTEENEITLVFNDVPDSSTLTANSLRVYAKESQEEIPINGILVEGKKVTIVFDEKLSRKTVYVVEADESVCMENGSALDFFIAEFTTVGGYEEIVYIDDRSGEMFMKTDNVSTNHDMVKDSIALRGKYPKASWVFAFDGSMVKNQEGETYTFDGVPTEFIIYYYHFGNYDMHGIDLCDIKTDDTVAVIGCGMIGLIMLQLAKIGGAARLIALEPNKDKRELAKKMGADICIDPLNEDAERVLKENDITRVTKVIECVGHPQTMKQAIELAGKKSIVMFFGLTAPDDTIDIKPFEIFKKEIEIKASYINPYTQQRAIEMIDSKRIDVKSMIYKVASLEELPGILGNKELRGKGKFIINPNA